MFPSSLRVSESVAFLYFVYLLTAAALKAPWPRRKNTMAASAVAAIAALGPMTFPDTDPARFTRDWLPAVFLTIGYWLSGWFFVAPMKGIEARLLGWDWRVLGRDCGASLVAALPRPVLEMLELVYVSCFLFVPGGLLTLALTGHRSAADRFWTLVLLGEFGSFAALPWIQTRPPRTIEPPGAIDRRSVWMRQMNQLQIATVSIGVNTFPSGHVAGALATAIAVSEQMPSWTPWLLAIVLAIAVAAVLGRYHYFIDAVAGAALTLAAWACLLWLWP